MCLFLWWTKTGDDWNLPWWCWQGKSSEISLHFWAEIYFFAMLPPQEIDWPSKIHYDAVFRNWNRENPIFQPYVCRFSIFWVSSQECFSVFVRARQSPNGLFMHTSPFYNNLPKQIGTSGEIHVKVKELRDRETLYTYACILQRFIPHVTSHRAHFPTNPNFGQAEFLFPSIL